MNALNILEIYEQKKKDKQDKSKYYNVILEKCYTKIRDGVKHNKWEIIWTVPKFVIGLPIYNYNHCIAHVMTHLKSNGFVIVYRHPGILLISWKPEDVKQFNTLKNLEQNSIYTINNGPQKLSDCINYEAQYNLQNFNTASLEDYIKSKRQTSQLALPAMPSPMSKDVVNNTIGTGIINDNRIINMNEQPLVNNPTANFASVNTNNNPVSNLHEMHTNQSSNIHNNVEREYKPMQSYLQYTHEQPIKRENEIQERLVQQNANSMKNIVVSNMHQQQLEKKILNDDYEHHQNMKEASLIVNNNPVYTREKQYEKQQMENRKKNLSNINNLLMSKDYLKKFKDINDKGRKMMNL